MRYALPTRKPASEKEEKSAPSPLRSPNRIAAPYPIESESALGAAKSLSRRLELWSAAGGVCSRKGGEAASPAERDLPPKRVLLRLQRKRFISSVARDVVEKNEPRMREAAR